MANNRFSGRFGKPTFKCQCCLRTTRETGQGVDHLCEDCWEIAGIDNSINDSCGERSPKDFPELEERLKHVQKLRGDVERVKNLNEYAFPKEAK
jgi:hypothetical protein